MLNYLINAFATLFVTIDPVGLAPMFLALTSGSSQKERTKIAIQATLIGGSILLVFLIAGRGLLAALGISVPAFQTAGGLLLLIIAVEMIFEIRQKRKAHTAEKAAAEPDHRQLAVFPLAIPLIAGPAAISAVILLSADAPSELAYGGLIAVTFGVVGLCLIAFILAGAIEKVLGETAQMVLTRLLGVLLAALAVQFIADGIKAFILAS